MRENYCLEKVIKVTLEEAKLDKMCTLHPEKKILGLWNQEAYISIRYGDRYSITEFLDKFGYENYVDLKNNAVYTKPKVTLYFEDGSSKSYYYADYALAKMFRKQILEKLGPTVNEDGLIQ